MVQVSLLYIAVETKLANINRFDCFICPDRLFNALP